MPAQAGVQTQPQTQPETQAPTQTQTPTVTQSPTPTLTQTQTSSALEQENDLFAEGIDKRRSGDVAGALAAFDRYLAKYPNGHDAESAAIERFRLSKSDPARAKAAAREYLRRWPNGSERKDAQAVLDGSP
jgi:TolA-binding protein